MIIKIKTKLKGTNSLSQLRALIDHQKLNATIQLSYLNHLSYGRVCLKTSQPSFLLFSWFHQPMYPKNVHLWFVRIAITIAQNELFVVAKAHAWQKDFL